ncbi:MAG: Uncharacterised protein [Cyanobium sp. ARS6]|nr:MAG: Uncharacterised protein [Cyanobium sp. ARS6]
MHKPTHKKVISLVGCPQKLEAGHRRPFTQLLAVINQRFGDGEMIRLMDQCEAMCVEPFLNSAQGQSTQIQIQKAEQIEGCDAVFDRHAVTSLQDDRLTACHQNQAGEWVDGRRSGPTVKWHAEAERSSLSRRAVNNGPQRSIGVEHAGELLGLRPANAMSNQESTNLCRRGLLPEHEFQSICSFLSTQAFAGVFAAPDFAEMLFEAFAAVADSACQGPNQRFMQCSAERSLLGVAIATDRFTRASKALRSVHV